MLLVTAIASALAVLLVASIIMTQTIAQAQEEAVLTCVLSEDRDEEESVVKCIVPPVEEEPVEEETEPYIGNTYPMELPVMSESYPVRVFAKIDGIGGRSNHIRS